MKWTQEETATLRNKYPTVEMKQLLSLLPKRDRYSIKNKVHALKLTKKYSKLWTYKEDKLLKKIYSNISNNTLTDFFPTRTKAAIITRASLFNLHKTPETISTTLSVVLKGKNKGKKRPDLVRYNKEHILNGKDNPFFGKKHSEKTRKKISKLLKVNSAFHRLNKNSDFQLKRRTAHKKAMQNPEVIQKIMKAQHIRPNIPENKLISIIEKYLLPFRYVGDGKVIIGTANPDFIHKYKKIIIEVFGNYWHDNMRRELKYNQTEEGRKKYFSKYGYQTIIFWENELKAENAETIVLDGLRGIL